MSDQWLRELERAWKESGSVEDEAVYLAERVRVGDLRADLFKLAAYLGHEPAVRTCAETDPCPHDLRSWVTGLAAWGRYTCTLAALAAAEAALEECRSDSGGDLGPESATAIAVDLTRAWLGCPCEEHVPTQDIKFAATRLGRRLRGGAREASFAVARAVSATRTTGQRRPHLGAAEQAASAARFASTVLPEGRVRAAIRQAIVPLILRSRPHREIRLHPAAPPEDRRRSLVGQRARARHAAMRHRPEWTELQEFCANEENWRGGPLYFSTVDFDGEVTPELARRVWEALWLEPFLLGPFRDQALTTCETLEPWCSDEEFFDSPRFFGRSRRSGALQLASGRFVPFRVFCSARDTAGVRLSVAVCPRAVTELTGERWPFMDVRLIENSRAIELHNRLVELLRRLHSRLDFRRAHLYEESWSHPPVGALSRLPGGSIVVCSALAAGAGDRLDERFVALAP